MIGSNDIDKSYAFYSGLLPVLGVNDLMPIYTAKTGERRFKALNGGVRFNVTEPINGKPATVANGFTLGFKCDTPEQAKDAWEAAVKLGGTPIEDDPGFRTPTHYLAYVRDPDGTKLCFMWDPEYL